MVVDQQVDHLTSKNCFISSLKHIGTNWRHSFHGTGVNASNIAFVSIFCKIQILQCPSQSQQVSLFGVKCERSWSSTVRERPPTSKETSRLCQSFRNSDKYHWSSLIPRFGEIQWEFYSKYGKSGWTIDLSYQRWKILKVLVRVRAAKFFRESQEIFDVD